MTLHGPQSTSFIDMTLKEVANHHESLSPTRATHDGQAAKSAKCLSELSIDPPTEQSLFPQILAGIVMLALHKPIPLHPPFAAPDASSSAGSQRGENWF